MVLCRVYRSGKKAETYLYLEQDMTFDDLPAALRAAFGEPAFVMQLTLGDGRRLARVDVQQVVQELETQGYYLQLPPELPVEDEIAQRFS